MRKTCPDRLQNGTDNLNLKTLRTALICSCNFCVIRQYITIIQKANSIFILHSKDGILLKKKLHFDF